MNWLAHLYLSQPDPAFRLGNLLPDLLPAPALAEVSEEFQRGAEQHRRIDAFTDSHPTFRQSSRRLSPAFRRFGGILTDVFYDHFLARDWAAYSSQPLAEFVTEVHQSIDGYRDHLPSQAYLRLCEIRAGNWLGSYGELAGIDGALKRIGQRIRRPVDFTGALVEFESSYSGFHDDFNAFFPELVKRFGGAA